MKPIDARYGFGPFSRLREKAGDEGWPLRLDPHPTLSRRRERELKTLRFMHRGSR